MQDAVRGFTMLELMITLAIVAVLAAVAIPSYKLYIDKAKFSEVIQAIGPYKTAVEICSHLKASLTDANICATPGQGGIPQNFISNPSRGFVSSISTSLQGSDVLITAESQHLSATYTYILRGEMESDGGINWHVDSASTCVSAGVCHNQ